MLRTFRCATQLFAVPSLWLIMIYTFAKPGCKESTIYNPELLGESLYETVQVHDLDMALIFSFIVTLVSQCKVQDMARTGLSFMHTSDCWVCILYNFKLI
jgi:hypothetical protein